MIQHLASISSGTSPPLVRGSEVTRLKCTRPVAEGYCNEAPILCERPGTHRILEFN